jgi:hypothetical protein
MPVAGQGSAGGLWTHTPVDWAGNLGAPKPAGWPLDAVNGSPGYGHGARPSTGTLTVIGAPGSTPGTGTATITWTTTLPSDSTVEYGTTTAYGNLAYVGTQVTSHSVLLSGLTSAVLIHYRCSSMGPGYSGQSGDATVTPT